MAKQHEYCEIGNKRYKVLANLDDLPPEVYRAAMSFLEAQATADRILPVIYGDLSRVAYAVSEVLVQEVIKEREYMFDITQRYLKKVCPMSLISMANGMRVIVEGHVEINPIKTPEKKDEKKGTPDNQAGEAGN